MKVTKGIDWIITCTDNFEATVAFFRDVMNLSIIAEGVPVVDTQFTRYALIRMPNGVSLEIVEPTSTARQLYDAPIVSITVADLSQARLEMERQQVEFVTSIFDDQAGWGWYYFRAPDNNIYQIQGPYQA